MKVQEFFNWTNPRLYLVGLFLIGLFWIILNWKKFKKWWNSPIDEEEENDKED